MASAEVAVSEPEGTTQGTLAAASFESLPPGELKAVYDMMLCVAPDWELVRQWLGDKSGVLSEVQSSELSSHIAKLQAAVQ